MIVVIYLKPLSLFIKRLRLANVLRKSVLLSLCLILLINKVPHPTSFRKTSRMDEKTRQFLNIISQIESSGGKNVNHKPMTEGLHAGTTAYGEFGITPNTTKDVVNRLNSIDKLSDNTSPIYAMPTEKINDYLKQNPEAEREIASFLARNLLARHKGNDEAAAYSWNMGSSLTPEQITEDKLSTNPYVSKYKQIKQEALKKLIQ